MKKLFLLFVATVLAMSGAKAQETSTLVATLNHEGKLLAYYGKGALVSAYNAARDGDVITLSAGTFTAVNVSKNITVRGVGMVTDIPTSNSYTALDGALTITIQNNDSPMVFEGLYFLNALNEVNSNTAKRITFSKVRFKGVADYPSITCAGNVYPVFNSCRIPTLTCYGGLLQNCLVEWIHNKKGNDPLTINNCVISQFRKADGRYYSEINYANFTNTLLVGDGTLVPNWSTYTATNCVGFSTAGNNGSFFASGGYESNRMVEDRDNFFKESSKVKKQTDQYGDLTGYTLGSLGDYLLDGTGGLYQLSDEAAQIYKGNDGTVVGVWGGANPFNITPSNPRIKKCEIVPKTDANGKLSVTIEVAQ